MVLEMVMESLFAVVDMLFVARLGQDAVAAVGLTESMVTILFAIALGLSMATTATVARRIGEKDPEAAAVAAVQALIAGVAVSVAVGIVGFIYAEDLLRLMGASPQVIEQGRGFTTITLGLSAPLILIFLLNAVFRGAGDAAIAMRVLWLANLLNIVLDPCFIWGLGPFPELGLTGAAVATAIGRGLAVAYQVWMLFGGRSRVPVTRRSLRLDPAVLSSLIRISLPGMAQYAIATASWVGLVRIIAVFGSPALAGYTIAIRIVVFAILPSWGLSNAAATLVGQCLGANKPDRAEDSVWRTGISNAVFLGSLGLIFIFGAGPVVRIFTSDPEVVAIATTCLRYVAYGYPFYAIGMVVVQAFNGAGDTLTPTIINLFCYWVFEIPLAWVLAQPVGMGPTGVFLSITLAESAMAVVAILQFRRGRWKSRKV
ncbi:MAG: MATE family efflux transporter [Bryobacterales bacterium]|nr:MATE family efflux transporter [Bryobacterales bacterium]